MKTLRVTVNGVSYEVDVEVLEDDESGVAYGLPTASVVQAPVVPAPAAPKPVTSAPAASQPAAELTSPIAGVVQKVNVSVGVMVKANQPVVVVEAMKMNTNISAKTPANRSSGSPRTVTGTSGLALRRRLPMVSLTPFKDLANRSSKLWASGHRDPPDP